MANIEMVIDSIRVSMQNYQRVVILKEKVGVRYLPIWIGPAEADAIAVRTQGISLSTPLTHDFMCATIDTLGASLQSAIIRKLENDAFFAKVVLHTDKGPKEIDCRPSDALAVAVRKNVPIYVDEGVLKKAGIVLSEETRKSFGQSAEGMATSQKPGEGRLDTLSEAVQHILATCEAEAKGLDCSYICTGHLFLALVKESNKATKVIENAGVSLERIRRDVEWSMKVEQDVEGGGVGLTPTVRGVIEASITEAKRLGSEKVLPEHVLLGLLRYPNGIAVIQLIKSGITLETVYVELIRLYSGNRSSLGLSI